jgi:SAM-dependent methyltransferase
MAKSSGPEYDILLRHGDAALNQFGDTHRGAHWPNERDRLIRFDVMLDVMIAPPGEPVVLCDFGCGSGELLAHIRRRGIGNIAYFGVDRSQTALDFAQAKFPGTRFLNLDVSDPGCDPAVIACDYLVANGLFTTKWELQHARMWEFLAQTVRRLWPHVRKGLAFNVMSKIVDWERDDLFHVPMDDVARLLHDLAGRHVLLRADYGLYEYTAYAFKGAPRIDLLNRPREPSGP